MANEWDYLLKFRGHRGGPGAVKLKPYTALEVLVQKGRLIIEVRGSKLFLSVTLF